MYDGKVDDKDLEEFYSAITSIKNVKICRELFEDLCTIQELKSMVQRYQVAKKLSSGENYEHIIKDTGASSATISRVKRCLEYGSKGYEKVLSQNNK